MKKILKHICVSLCILAGLVICLICFTFFKPGFGKLMSILLTSIGIVMMISLIYNWMFEYLKIKYLHYKFEEPDMIGVDWNTIDRIEYSLGKFFYEHS